MTTVVLPILLLVAGAAGAVLVARRRALVREAAARTAAERDLRAASTEAEARRAAGEVDAATESRRLAAELAEEVAREREDLAEYEAELVEREALLEGRERALAEAEEQVSASERASAGVISQAEALLAAARQVEARRTAELEGRSAVAASEVLEQLVKDIVSKVELDLRLRLREREEALSESAAADSRSVMQVAIERYDGAGHLERVQNAVPIGERRVFEALADPAGPCRAAFVDAVGCDLVLDEAQLSAAVRGDDPLAREIARRVLRVIGGMPHVDPGAIRRLAAHVSAEVDREVQNAGRRAQRILEVGPLHPDVLSLVGRLKFRLSYSQNQWRHSIEVGHLAGMMASELGLDVTAARRGGLLHDIGKAMTHDHEGSHAVLGAEVARRHGEDEAVVNAIASHHNDEQPRSPLALVVTAADALSGGRPGARRESVTQYLNRIHDIQRIAGRSPAVKRVDIMQAGREVRVVVAGVEQGSIDPSERHGGPVVSDAELTPMAQDIARRIESEITFAGQIKVTVIRESRAVSVAH